MGIPVALTYTTTVRGSVLKDVTCEHCKSDYVYVLSLQASGSGTSVFFTDNAGAEMRATRNADAALEQGLKKMTDAAPCPACGSYQKDMIKIVRRAHKRWIQHLGFGLLAAFCVAGLIALGITISPLGQNLGMMLMAWSVSIILLLAGLGLIIHRTNLLATFDPNAGDAGPRIQKTRAMLRQDFDKLMRERQQAAEDQ